MGEGIADRLAATELEEQLPEHRFNGIEDIVLFDKCHLDVELVELSGRTVGPGILVAEARRDLEVAVEARDHGELLVLLWRLGEGIEFARMQARRHQEVPGALRA